MDLFWGRCRCRRGGKKGREGGEKQKEGDRKEGVGDMNDTMMLNSNLQNGYSNYEDKHIL